MDATIDVVSAEYPNNVISVTSEQKCPKKPLCSPPYPKKTHAALVASHPLQCLGVSMFHNCVSMSERRCWCWCVEGVVPKIKVIPTIGSCHPKHNSGLRGRLDWLKTNTFCEWFRNIYQLDIYTLKMVWLNWSKEVRWFFANDSSCLYKHMDLIDRVGVRLLKVMTNNNGSWGDITIVMRIRWCCFSCPDDR